jgi:signal transduction histidine kinase
VAREVLSVSQSGLLGTTFPIHGLDLKTITPIPFRAELSEFRPASPAIKGSARISARRSGGETNGNGDSKSREDKNAIIAVQWLVAIATSYLIFAAHDWNLTQPLPALLIMVCLVSAAILRRIPEYFFEKRLIEPGLLVLDSVLIISAITILHDVPWDLLILFFFCVFIAVIGENLVQSAIGCVLLSLVFLTFVSPHTVDALSVDSNSLFRVPFIFGISICYGHLANQVKREKKRMETLKEAAILKRQLVCALAHDIKAPLNVILGHSELLAGECGGHSSPAEKYSSLKCVRENIDRILNLITDFLDVSKLETLTPQFARESVQMNVIAQDVVLQHMVIAREKNISLALDLDPNLKTTLGDDNQLQRALWNLVANAIKFTPSGGRVIVATGMRKKQLFIEVKDTGIGIAEEELPKLFLEFQRLNGNAEIEGTGLGLFIVKTIVEGHGGKVAVESEVGVGSTFTILLPSSKGGPLSSDKM